MLKTALILWFFMQLRDENGLVRVFAIGAVVWLMILFGHTVANYVRRQ